jgi:hypothetical protein
MKVFFLNAIYGRLNADFGAMRRPEKNNEKTRKQINPTFSLLCVSTRRRQSRTCFPKRFLRAPQDGSAQGDSGSMRALGGTVAVPQLGLGSQRHVEGEGGWVGSIAARRCYHLIKLRSSGSGELMRCS